MYMVLRYIISVLCPRYFQSVLFVPSICLIQNKLRRILANRLKKREGREEEKERKKEEEEEEEEDRKNQKKNGIGIPKKKMRVCVDFQ